MVSDTESAEIERLLARSVPALLACEAALPTFDGLSIEHEYLKAADERGHFHPDEEELVLLRYSQYLAVRSALIQTLAELQQHIGGAVRGWRRWPHRLPVFAAAYAAGCMLHRAAGHLVDLAAERPVVWKKLDEENLRAGLPAKTFSRIYREFSRPSNMTRLLVAMEFHRRHRDEVMELAGDPLLGPVVELLKREEPKMELSKREAIKRGASYGLFSFLRRQRSAWKQVTFSMFEAGGRAVSVLRMPGIKPSGAPKRISHEIQRQLLDMMQPGDVIVTRHDDALSNLFLPGYWPHAALFIGESSASAELSADQVSGDISGPCFLEAKKDGVRVRPIRETFGVDELILLRPPIEAGKMSQLLEKSQRDHAGKPYDFVFDFRSAERLVCTEVVYRTYHGIGPVSFELMEVGGRLCLPAETFLDQSMACGFELLATAGMSESGRGGGVLKGDDARRAFESMHRGLTASN